MNLSWFNLLCKSKVLLRSKENLKTTWLPKWEIMKN